MPRPLDSPREPLRLGEAPSAPNSDAREADTITGRRCVVAFDAYSHEIRFHDATPEARLTLVVQGRPGLARVTAHGFVRDIVSGRAAFDERCFVFHDLPLAILEWTARQPATGTLLHLEIVVRSGATDPLCRISEGAVRIDAGDRRFILLTGADARLAVREDPDALRIDVALHADPGPARIAIAASLIDGDNIESTLDAARNADARVRARTASLRRRDRESIRLRSSDPSADAALRNAVLRIDAVRPAMPTGHDRAVPENSGFGGSGAGWPWIGALDRIGPAGRLAIAALAAGDPDIARNLIARMADPDGLLALTLYGWTGDTSSLPPGSADPTPPDLADDPPPAALAARRITAFDPLLPDSVAAPVLGLVLDVLGAAPDAGRGRLRLRPLLPDDWRFMEVTGLPMADARLRLRMARTDSGVDLEIEQTHGAMPIRAVLEPVVAARALLAAAVDGEPASLSARPVGDLIRVPVQLALDHARRLTLQLDRVRGGR